MTTETVVEDAAAPVETPTTEETPVVETPQTEEKLDTEPQKDTIIENEDKWSEDFNMDDLFKDFFKEDEEQPVIQEETPKEEDKTQELNKTIEELNALITEWKTKFDEQLAEKDSAIEELNKQMETLKQYEVEFEKNNAAWAKLDENPVLKNIVTKFFAWEEIDILEYLTNAMSEDLDWINNTIENPSDAEKPAWKLNLQQMMQETNQK